MAKGLLYYYFGSKRGFYMAVIEAAARELRLRVPTDPALPPAERFARGVEAYIGYAAEHSEGYRTLIAGGVGSDSQVRAIVERERAAWLEEIVAGLTGRRRPRPALRAALQGWFGFLEGVTLDWLAARDLDREQAVALALLGLTGALAAARAVDPRAVPPLESLGL
jgi:AcrR family transcriptional regulator